MVMIRLDNHGMIVKLDEETAFEEIKREMERKLRQSIRFFRNAKIALTIQGRKLSEQQEQEIIEIIESVGEMEVVCLIDHDGVRDSENLQTIDLVMENRALKEERHQLLEERKKKEELDAGRFYKGTLRSGQVLESDGSIIVLGDVNPGGKIISKHNVIVLGALKGYACAGMDGEEQSFVAALDMKPAQIRIGDVIARSSDHTGKAATEPKIAFLKEGSIFIEDISKSTLNGLSFKETK